MARDPLAELGDMVGDLERLLTSLRKNGYCTDDQHTWYRQRVRSLQHRLGELAGDLQEVELRKYVSRRRDVA